MGRALGGTNKKNYKYLMSVDSRDFQYFASYAEIWNKYPDLNKSSITNILFHPERILNNKKYTIIKLTKPMPVYLKIQCEDNNGNWITKLENIDYSIKLHQLEVEASPEVSGICPRIYPSPTAPPCPIHEAYSYHT